MRGAFRPRIVAAITEVLGLQLGYCEGLHCGQRVMVPAHATPVSRSATVSNVSASLWHVLHGSTWMLPGLTSRWSSSSIVTITYVGLLVDEVDHSLFGLTCI